jgi:hypothetical protein
MLISRPCAKDATPEELRELEHLRVVIERATKDGVVSQYEVEELRELIITRAPGHRAQQICREMALYRSLVTEKVQRNEIQLEILGG